MTYQHFNNETTRSSVLKAVADTGNEAAWARLFDLYADFVFSIAYAYHLGAGRHIESTLVFANLLLVFLREYLLYLCAKERGCDKTLD